MDISFVFFLPSQVIGTIAGVAYLLDRDGKFRNRFADSGDHLLSKHPVLFYYCVGKFIFCWVAWNVGLHRFVLVNSVSLVAVNSLMTNVFETVFLFTVDRVLYSNETVFFFLNWYHCSENTILQNKLFKVHIS